MTTRFLSPTLLTPILLALVGCTGVQTGDVGDADVTSCNTREVAIEDLEVAPERFDLTPAEMLAPALTLKEATLSLQNGTDHPLHFSFEVSANAPIMAVYRDETPGIEDCEAEGLQLELGYELDGGDAISGSGTATLTAMGEQIWISLSTDSLALSSDLGSGIDENSELTAPLQLDLDNVWRGTWTTSVAKSCENESECSGTETTVVGTFNAQSSSMQ